MAHTPHIGAILAHLVVSADQPGAVVDPDTTADLAGGHMLECIRYRPQYEQAGSPNPAQYVLPDIPVSAYESGPSSIVRVDASLGHNQGGYN